MAEPGPAHDGHPARFLRHALRLDLVHVQHPEIEPAEHRCRIRACALGDDAEAPARVLVARHEQASGVNRPFRLAPRRVLHSAFSPYAKALAKKRERCSRHRRKPGRRGVHRARERDRHRGNRRPGRARGPALLMADGPQGPRTPAASAAYDVASACGSSAKSVSTHRTTVSTRAPVRKRAS